MDSLPQELIDRICDYLSGDDLKQTLTVSPYFQYASERASGAYARFELTEKNAEKFLDSFSGRRVRYLRHVEFRCTLPPYVEEEEVYDEKQIPGGGEEENRGDDNIETSTHHEDMHRFRESASELQEKDEIFSQRINFVFATLRTLEERVKRNAKLHLTLYTPIRDVQGSLQRKFISWRLHLLQPSLLPELDTINALHVKSGGIVSPLEEDESLLKLDLRVLLDLAVKLPNLEHLDCKLGNGEWTSYHTSEAIRHYTRDCAGPRRDSRHDFASVLNTVRLPSTLREAHLDFLYPLFEAERIDQREEMPDLVNPLPYDPFSSSLRLISQQLRKMQLNVVADKTLFWPADGSDASWPNLESLHVMFHITTPSGSWYFREPHGAFRHWLHDSKGFEITEASYPPLEDTSDDEDWEAYVDDHGLDLYTVKEAQFRIIPSNEVLVPFLASFARAASTMQGLKEACIWAPLRYEAGFENLSEYAEYPDIPDRPWAWGIAFAAPGRRAFHVPPGENNSSTRQLWWVTSTWRPDDELRRMFQHIGNQDATLVEHWGITEVVGGILANRVAFERYAIF